MTEDLGEATPGIAETDETVAVMVGVTARGIAIVETGIVATDATAMIAEIIAMTEEIETDAIQIEAGETDRGQDLHHMTGGDGRLQSESL
mmetsp:Transcript_27508/g.63614  ORF Transcript_27508/g.63614 Transcript_27508/m.63614 type:complete len:90 (-) Transcript_27508:37-306(-)